MDQLQPLVPSLAPPVARLVIDADFDPQLPSRVLAKFAERGRLPLHFTLDRVDAERVQLVAEFDGDPQWARYLSRKLLGSACVRSVQLSFRRAARPSRLAA